MTNRLDSTPRTALLALALLLLASLPVHALTYLVGAGAVPAQCDFNSIQAAVNAAGSSPGEDSIRIANDQTYSAQALTIGQQDLTLTGGYADCELCPTGDFNPLRYVSFAALNTRVDIV